MRDIIDPVDTPDGLFHDGDPSTGTEGTVVHARWLNDNQGATIDLQNELKAVLTAAGIDPNGSQLNQLLTALNSLFLTGDNEAVKNALQKANNLNDVANKSTALGNLGGVPATRKVGGKELTQDITLTAVDVGALPSGGTAAAATKLATARTIAGVAFDGTTNIALTAAGVGALPSGGTAAAATKLATPRTIAGVSFNGTANIAIPAGNVGAYTKAESDARYLTTANLTTAGAVGSLAFLSNNTGNNIAPNTNIAASSLSWASVGANWADSGGGGGNYARLTRNGSPAGTWRAMCFIAAQYGDGGSAGLFIRIS